MNEQSAVLFRDRVWKQIETLDRYIFDAEFWNQLNPDVAPLDTEGATVLRYHLKNALDKFAVGDLQGFGDLYKKALKYAETME